ncbi:hypothetical protein SXCC_03879 [Gluconacetobacter sp. SXCC-1]|uniref:Uncharacterized protein n=1 Tax=Komagataeibacter rhaeticus TaxID=215221 RepID=A0A181CC24_9PROT|nr:hypothetical protein [Komagataeibacter rhaeticus]ATU72022.1 hypothetical protein CT154_03330 [Komagataeibacter xylinus]EGG75444.1 hypothetical protein SXCC_03879 [Gluconacetobacter sp. SXCC-1]QIP35855.1 hypothetical protein GWK63_10585 [Komagataeibacter rhaeticus]QOC45615.1 hypothetical protein ICJ78_10630 [Komagataeibacter rhaeticus]WPP21721.1 hypothetical protein SCD25_15145 [Komagataeibacter rhaeticus]
MSTPTPSITRTLCKTVAVLVLTGLFMLGLRFSATVAGLVDRVAGTGLWLSVYRLAGASDATEQERLIVMAVALACCLLAVGVVEGTDRLLRRYRPPRS